jgi:hypothetical protein
LASRKRKLFPLPSDVDPEELPVARLGDDAMTLCGWRYRGEGTRFFVGVHEELII